MGAGSLKILTGVLVHRVTRPLRGSVLCGSGGSVPCVSIQLTLSHKKAHFLLRIHTLYMTPYETRSMFVTLTTSNAVM